MSASKPVGLADDAERAAAREYIIARVVVDANGCWVWQRNKLHAGHGQAKWRGRPMKAHRLSYAAFVEEPGEMGALHRCDHPPCVCPDHIFLGTKGDNNRDAAVKGRYMMRATKILTEQMCSRAFDLHMGGLDVPEVAKELGVAALVVYPLLIGRSYPHLPRPNGYQYRRTAANHGTDVAGAVLNDDLVRLIRSSDEKQAAIAARLGITQSAVSMIRARKSWKHVA